MSTGLLEDLRGRFPRVAIAHDWLTIPGGSEQVLQHVEKEAASILGGMLAETTLEWLA